MDLLARPHVLVASGALGIALTTAAEVFTAPYSAHVGLYALNPPVHAVKIVAALVFVVGILAVGLGCRTALGRVGAGAASALAVGTTFGAIPYSVVETTLDRSLSTAEAAAWLDASYEARLAWIGHLATVGMLLILVGLVTLAGVVLRRRLLPWWRPLLSLGALPLGVLAGVLGETTSLPVPHPPAWVFLCLGIAYAAPLRHVSGSGPGSGAGAVSGRRTRADRAGRPSGVTAS